jgi:hypothetical protein
MQRTGVSGDPGDLKSEVQPKCEISDFFALFTKNDVTESFAYTNEVFTVQVNKGFRNWKSRIKIFRQTDRHKDGLRYRVQCFSRFWGPFASDPDFVFLESPKIMLRSGRFAAARLFAVRMGSYGCLHEHMFYGGLPSFLGSQRNY